MKPGNFTLQQDDYSFKSTFHSPNSYCFYSLITITFLLLSIISFGGTVNSNHPLPSSHNNSLFLENAGSPLTGSESIRSTLYLLNANNTTILADGVYTEYNSLYHDSVYLEDAYKFTNILENLGLTRYGAVLSVERRPLIANTDTLFFKLWKTTRRNYQFEFTTIKLDHPGMQAFLEDAYLVTRTPVVLNGKTIINFSVNSDAASSNVNRFRIIYETIFNAIVLPVTFTSVKGYLLNNKISIDWKVENEINIEKYDIERSANGINFTKVISIAATAPNSGYNRYWWIDENSGKGNNYYRIKSVDHDGAKKYSPMVKVTTGETGGGSVTVYPNPVKNNLINLRFTNQPAGNYQLRLVNNTGQIVYSGVMAITGSNVSRILLANSKLPGGIYQLEIVAPDNSSRVQKVIVQE